jgi:hypothetical protein
VYENLGLSEEIEGLQGLSGVAASQGKLATIACVHLNALAR